MLNNYLNNQENGDQMTAVYFIKGPQRADKTSSVIDFMYDKQMRFGAFSYLFLGSSGGFLQRFRERYLNNADAIINSNFKVINQYVVEELKRHLPEKVHVDREMLSALVLDVLADNSELKDLLNSGVGIVEMFLNYFSVVNEQDPDQVFADTDGTEDQLIQLFAGLYAKFRRFLEQNNMFATDDAYRLIAGIIDKGDYQMDNNKQFLFIDGFNDFPKPIRDFLLVFIPLFQEVYITIPTTLDHIVDEVSFAAFENSMQQGLNRENCQIQQIRVDNHDPSIVDQMCDVFSEGKKALPFCKPMSLSDERPMRFIKTANPPEQYRYVGTLVKDLVLKEKIPLDEIGIIARNIDKSGLACSRIFDNMGIPYRFERDCSILESITINRLILPFRVFQSGFDSEMILNYLESGFVDLDNLSFATLLDLFDKAGLSYGKYYQQGYSDRFMSLKKRKENWYERLNRYERFIKERLEAHKSTIEEEIDVMVQDEQTLENITKVKSLLGDVFTTLGLLFESMRKRSFREYYDYFQYLYQKLHQRGIITTDHFEQQAVLIFFEQLLPALKHFFVVVHHSNDPMIRPIDFWKYLNIYLENSRFHSSEFIENKCLIMDLESSRYRQTAVRIYIDFLEGHYPKVVFNKVYDLLFVNGMPFIDTYLLREERDFLLSLRKTTQKAFFVHPAADINGTPYHPSFYIQRLCSYFQYTDKTFNGVVVKDMSQVDNLNDYAIKDYLISKLDKITVEDKGFIQLCSQFGYDWNRIKKKVVLLHKNNETAFRVENKEAVSQMFGDTLSPSKYGVLKKCFNDFFFRYILHVKTISDVKEGFDYFVEGQILHSILHGVFQGLSKRDQLLENLSEIKFHAFFKDTVLRIIQNEIKAKMFHPEQILYEAEVSYFSKLIKDFLEKYRNSKFCFSNPDPESYGSSVFIPKQFEIEITRKDAIRFIEDRQIYFVGKIDRIDMNEAGDLFIYDYKRSDSSAKREASHQLMMYAYAASKRFNLPLGMAFLPVISKKEKMPGLFLKYNPEDDLYLIVGARKDKELTFQDLIDEIDTHLSQVFKGQFLNQEAVNCYQCPQKETGVCDIRKKEDNP